MGTNGPTITGSAAIHAERIRAREAERAAAPKERDARQTYEIYGERAAAGARADEELRRQAMLNGKRARGEWVPGDDEAEGEVDEEFEEENLEAEEDEEEAEPVSTAERYARIERERQRAEHDANVRARGSQSGAPVPQVNQWAAQLVQPHRYAHLWQKPAS